MSKKPTVFLREATGLVREISWFNVFTFTATTIGFQFSFYYAASLAPLIGGNLLIGVLMMAIGLAVVIIGYTTLISVMPRSGGDYVYNSRLLHPLIGFVGNMVFVIVALLFAAINSETIESTGLSQLFAYWGVIYHNSYFLALSSSVASLSSILVLGTIWIILGAVVAVFSVRSYFRLQNLLFVVVVVGIVSMIAALIPLTQPGFVSSFNQFVSQYNGTPGDYYHSVISDAQKSGWSIPDQTSLWGGLLLYPILAIIGFNNTAAQLGGEIRQAKRSFFIGSLLGALYWLIPFSLILLLVYNTVGFSFMSSIDYLLYNTPSMNPLPATPYINLIIASATTPILGSLIIVAGLVQLFIYVPSEYLFASRAFFAYSFDGLFPKQFADVSERTHGPVKSIILAAITTFVLYIIINLPQSSSYAYLFGSVASWLVTIPIIFVGISIMVLPWRRPHLAAGAPIRGPALVGVGALILVFMSVVDYLLLSQAVYGANTPIAIELAVGVFAVLVIIYAVRRLN